MNKDSTVSLRVKRRDKQVWRLAAATHEQRLSDWIRDTLDRAARGPSDLTHVSEILPAVWADLERRAALAASSSEAAA